MDIIYIIYAYFIVVTLAIILIVYLYKEKHDEYMLGVQLITLLSSISIAFALILNGFGLYRSESNDSVIGYSTNAGFLLNDPMNIFMSKPYMMYMYNQMMGVPNIDPIVRHRDEEILVGCYIFANCAKVCAFIFESPNKGDSDRMKSWMIKILNQYLKSPILLSVWKNEYKPKLAGPLLIKFMQDNFSL